MLAQTPAAPRVSGGPAHYWRTAAAAAMTLGSPAALSRFPEATAGLTLALSVALASDDRPASSPRQILRRAALGP